MVAFGSFDADDESFGDLRYCFDRMVDTRAAHSHTVALQRRIGSAVLLDGVLVGDCDPVPVAPHSGVGIEIGTAAMTSVDIAPEADRHRSGDDTRATRLSV